MHKMMTLTGPRCTSLFVTLAALALCPIACGAPVFAVDQPWVTPTAGKRTTEAYMDITSSEDAALVAVRSDAAAKVSLRAPAGIKPAPRELRFPAHVTVNLAPGGYRLALTGLAAPLKRGDRVPLTLTIRHDSGTLQDIPVNAEVRLHSPLDDERRAHQHTHY
jgi:copper(I)-binding protein